VKSYVIAQAVAHVCFLPAYSPDINPIENVEQGEVAPM